jgi:hypothetical protein
MFKFHHPHLMALPPILPPGYIILKQNNWECPITAKLIIYALCSTHQTQAPISSLSHIWECPITAKLIIYALCSTHQTQAPISHLGELQALVILNVSLNISCSRKDIHFIISIIFDSLHISFHSTYSFIIFLKMSLHLTNLAYSK